MVLFLCVRCSRQSHGSDVRVDRAGSSPSLSGALEQGKVAPPSMPLTTVSAFGWPNCLRLANEAIEVLITTDVGPRILGCRRTGGENVLRVYEEQTGRTGEGDYQVRGGHRLWVSPETKLTYTPDNGPVEVEQIGEAAVRVVNPATPEAPVRKELTISLAEADAALELEHRLINESDAAMEIASWGITVMRPGGWEIIPQPPLGSHDTDLLPERVIVPWTYTDFSDPRWSFGSRFWRLRPAAERPATKLGFALAAGWAAYALPDTLFIKTFAYDPQAAYPDRGCNFETFSKGDFIELESLSPLVRLEPGAAVGHRETWHLLGDTPPSPEVDDAALAGWLEPLLAPLGLR